MATTRQHTHVSSNDDMTGGEGYTAAAERVPKRPVWELIVELGAQMPETAWAQVPDDASINFKHYLYGTPKKNV